MPDIQSNIALLCNPRAGAGRALQMAVALHHLLQGKQLPNRVFTAHWPKSLDGFTDVYLIGGDGTLNYYLNHYPNQVLPVAIFDGGTGNDFHWLLYGRLSLEEQLHKVLQAAPQPVDIGRCNQRFFINGLGIGFEGAVAKALGSRNKLPGKTSYLLTILQQVLTYRSQAYSLTCEEATYTGRQLLVDISNGRRAGGGFHVAPEARADDGLLDVVIVKALPPLQRLRYLPVIEKGKHLQLPFVRHFRTRQIHISSQQPFPFHLDGEYLEDTSLNVTIMPGRLLVRY